MQLKRGSWLVRLAYLGADEVPDDASLCVVFWRVVASPLMLWGLLLYSLAWPIRSHRVPRLLRLALSSCLAGSLLSLFVVIVLDDPSLFLVAFGLVLLAGGLVVGGLVAWDHVTARDPLVLSYLRARKQRFCPKVEFV